MLTLIYIICVISNQAENAFGAFLFRELRAVAGAITITCLMVCNRNKFYDFCHIIFIASNLITYDPIF